MGAKAFYEWFLGWYKPISNDVNVMISVPNEIQPYIQDDVIILDLFKGTSDSVNTLPYLKTLLQKVDEHELTVYLDPNPRGSEQKTRVSNVFKYGCHGFKLTSNKEFMVRVPKTNNL
jgi:hypothetical protein